MKYYNKLFYDKIIEMDIVREELNEFKEQTKIQNKDGFKNGENNKVFLYINEKTKILAKKSFIW